MYGENQTLAQTAQSGASRTQGPLTVEVMETLNRAQDIANEVRHRLFELRGRLVGHSPEGVSRAGDPKSNAEHFRATHAERSDGLLSTLADIDRLSMDLANSL